MVGERLLTMIRCLSLLSLPDSRGPWYTRRPIDLAVEPVAGMMAVGDDTDLSDVSTRMLPASRTNSNFKMK